MEKVIKKLVNTFTWSADADLSPINLPREGLITEVRLRWRVDAGSGSGWTTNTNVVDGFKRIMQNLKIEGEGGRSYLGLAGQQTSRLLAFMNCYDFRSPLITFESSIYGTEAAGRYVSVTFIFHPGSNPKDPFDMTAVIPAQDLAQLQIKCTATPAATIDNSTAIDAAVGYVTVFEVLGVPTPRGIMTPMSSVLSWPHDADHSDLSKEIDVPTGAWLRRIVMLVQDDTGTYPLRKDDEITAVGLKLPKVGKRLIDMHWEDLKAWAATQYQLPSVLQGQVADVSYGVACMPDGFAIMDFRTMGDPLYGLDLRNYVSGDIKLGLTVENYASGDDTLIFWDQLIPYAK